MVIGGRQPRCLPITMSTSFSHLLNTVKVSADCELLDSCDFRELSQCQYGSGILAHIDLTGRSITHRLAVIRHETPHPGRLAFSRMVYDHDSTTLTAWALPNRRSRTQVANGQEN